MQFEGKGRSTRLDWRRAAVLAVIALGFLTMVATSQPRWSLSATQPLNFAEGDQAVHLDLSTSSKNLNDGRLLNISIEAPGAADAPDWTLTLEGAEPETRAFKMTPSPDQKGEGRRGELEWRGSGQDNPDKLPICSEETCRLKVTLGRQGDKLPAVEVKLVVSLEGLGESKPPGGEAFDLKVVERP